METRRGKLALGLGALGIMLVLAWNAFTGGEDTGDLMGPREAAVSAEPDRPDRVQATRHREAGAEEMPAQVEHEEESSEDIVPTEQVWEPLYDRRLKAGEASIQARLVDAEGRRLDRRSIGRRPGLRLWRRLGPFGLEIREIRWDLEGSLGLLGRHGLEPGLFRVELDGGGYGYTRASFNVSSDEKLQDEVKFPGRWRVVGLRFIDQDGQPLPYLAGVPRFEARTGTTLPDRSATPKDVLQEPPAMATFETRFGTGGFSSFLPHRRRRSQQKYATLNGVYYVAVISGVTGFIKIPRQAHLYRTKDFFRSRFEGKEWDDRVVRVERRDGYETGMDRRTLANEDDPGGVKAADERLREAPPTKPAAPQRAKNPFEIPSGGTGSWTRFIVDFGNRPTLELVGTRCRKGASPQQAPLTLIRRQGALQWTSIRREETPYLRITDGLLYRTPWKKLDHAPDGLRIITPPPPGRRVTVEVKAPPTLTGLGRIMTIHLDQGEAFAPRRHVAVAPSPDGLYRLDSGLSPEQRQALDEAHTGRLVLGFGSDLASAREHRVTVPLSKAAVERLLAGQLEIDLEKMPTSVQRITFRCVGVLSEGLPWVEASVVPYDDEASARAMREILWRRRVLGQPAPTIAGLDEPPEEEAENSPDPERLARIRTGVRRLLDGLNADDLRRKSGRDLADAFPDPRQLRRFLENGSWYDAWNRLRTDDRGFVLAKAPYLAPGRHYVLYLWSKSRDALKPDRRLVFQAHPGFTDLGVISLPSY
ncbi:MAG TPA: hypothetical protein ENK43_17935 [Planctomycetes bacterium]|nr:hypothetical protein [Planctomycetota bacterium]